MRERTSRLIRPLLMLLSGKVSPNQLTLLGLVTSTASFLSFWYDYIVIGAILVLVTGFFDLLDGALARHTGEGSKWGAFLDSLVDRYTEIIIIAGISKFSTLGYLAITGSLLVSYSRSRAELEGVKCDVGLGSRPTRLLILGIVSPLPWGRDLSLIMVSIVAHSTALYRMFHTWSSLKNKRSSVVPMS
ncbi:hypothetical protein DRN52_02570 [Thermococci archaeon]|nr:MAG: hypothetical protein DRN52_02570 [Thermococci archaeon]